MASHLKHFTVRTFSRCINIVGQGAGQRCGGVIAHRSNLPTIKDICWQINALASFVGKISEHMVSKSESQFPTAVSIH